MVMSPPPLAGFLHLQLRDSKALSGRVSCSVIAKLKRCINTLPKHYNWR